MTDAGERAVGALIRDKYELAAEGVRTVSGHAQLCDNNPTLQLVLAMRQVYTAPINFLQARPGLLFASVSNSPCISPCLRVCQHFPCISS